VPGIPAEIDLKKLAAGIGCCAGRFWPQNSAVNRSAERDENRRKEGKGSIGKKGKQIMNTQHPHPDDEMRDADGPISARPTRRLTSKKLAAFSTTAGGRGPN
jgi:hypothetical protein